MILNSGLFTRLQWTLCGKKSKLEGSVRGLRHNCYDSRLNCWKDVIYKLAARAQKGHLELLHFFPSGGILICRKRENFSFDSAVKTIRMLVGLIFHNFSSRKKKRAASKDRRKRRKMSSTIYNAKTVRFTIYNRGAQKSFKPKPVPSSPISASSRLSSCVFFTFFQQTKIVVFEW